MLTLTTVISMLTDPFPTLRQVVKLLKPKKRKWLNVMEPLEENNLQSNMMKIYELFLMTSKAS